VLFETGDAFESREQRISSWNENDECSKLSVDLASGRLKIFRGWREVGVDTDSGLLTVVPCIPETLVLECDRTVKLQTVSMDLSSRKASWRLQRNNK
jgi:hypothetical protein